MSLYKVLARLIDRYGETMTLRRAGQADLTGVKVKRFNASNVEVAGSMTDTIVTLKITNTAIAGSPSGQAPRPGDTIGNFVIQAVDTRKLGETPVLHILLVGGGP